MLLTITGRNKAGVYLWVQDQDLARRIGKAFEHLIKLSGAEEEPFQN